MRSASSSLRVPGGMRGGEERGGGELVSERERVCVSERASV